MVEAAVCAKRNIHERTLAELTKICSNWVKTPDHMINLDVRTLLQDDAIQEVEMEDVLDEEPSSSAIATENVEGQDDSKDHQGSGNEGEEEEDDNNVEGFRKVIRSKWDGDVSETNLGKQNSGPLGVVFALLVFVVCPVLNSLPHLSLISVVC